MSERKSRDLDPARCVKSEDQKVWGKDNGIKERDNILTNFEMKILR